VADRFAGHANRYVFRASILRRSKMKGIGLWLLGVPVIVIVALYVFGIL
jgi:hypothetical protein